MLHYLKIKNRSAWGVISFVSFFALLILLSPSNSNCLTEIWGFSSGVWSGGAYKDDNGNFSHCYAGAQYESGISLVIGLTHNNDINIVLLNSSWELQKNDIYRVSLSVDKKNLGNYSATAAEKNGLLIEIGNKNYVYNYLKHGNTLIVSAEKQDFYFSLKGSNKALSKVQECVDLGSSLTASRKNPFASDNKNPFASSENESFNKDTKVLELLLKSSGLDEVTILNPMDSGIESADFAWKSGDIFGVLISDFTSNMNINELTKQILSYAASDCEGVFGSKSSEIVQLDGSSYMKQLYAACSDASENLFVAITALQNDTDVLFLVNFSSGEPGNLRSINSNLGDILKAIYTE